MNALNLADFLPKPLSERVLAQYRLPLDGIHGLRHWIRVWHNGEELARSTGARLEVVRLFSFLHDSCRHDEGIDLLHGVRAARFIFRVLQPEILRLPEEDMRLLMFAVQRHTFGGTRADATVMTCWDADRLDLGRVNIMPDAKYLCTSAAKDPEIISRAYRNSIALG